MRIKSVEVHGLLGRKGGIVLSLHDDLNIITGLNGSGKTTLIKLMWYIISGNVQHALEEIDFTKIRIETDLYKVSIFKISANTCKVEFDISGQVYDIEDRYTEDGSGEDVLLSDARDVINEKISDVGKSLFFPTFRRIEGGFTISTKQRYQGGLLFNANRNTNSELQDAVLTVSRRLSKVNHTFITSISTVDVVELLLRKYTELAEVSDKMQRAMSQDVIDSIVQFKREGARDDEDRSASAESVLDGVLRIIEEVDSKRNQILSPLSAVQKLGEKLFHHSGIMIGKSFTFGDAANAVNSDTLSAGEKQMLSFICYNALTENSVIFIDEPELSLHVDWQRQLFPTLLSQGTSNQFIISTHSPFIYSKFPDKELLLGENRGNISGAE